MDPGIVIAILSGVFTTVGIILNRIDKPAGVKAADAKTGVDRDALVNAEVWKLVEELKKSREDLKQEYARDRQN